MDKIKPIDLLKEEMLKWENEQTRIEELIYQNDSSVGNDTTHRLLRRDLFQCREVIRLYKHSIRKLKK